MLNALRVGYSVLRYRGGIGQWAWAVNRVAGLGVLLFLALHIVDIFVAGFGPGLFDELLFLYKGPVVRILDIFLVFGLLYHGINGLRLTLMDFKPTFAKHYLRLFYIQTVIFLVAFIPASLFLLNEFYGLIGGIIITAIVLALPLGVAYASTLLSGGNADVSTGNYETALTQLSASRGRPRSGFEFNMWLFMRVSGLILVFLALFHMVLMHLLISVEQITFVTLVDRWTGVQGILWRTYDLFLLIFAFTHGINGARNVMDDYFHSPGWRAFLTIGLWLFWFVLMVMGTFIIFTFNPSK